MNLNQLTIKQAADGLRKKEFSATELLSDCLHAIRERDPELHVYLNVFEEGARQEAQRADEMLSDSHEELPPMLGIPLAVKDNILIEGQPCTAGSKILEPYEASYDATVVTKLKAHGAIFIGKTNLDEFAMGSSTENSAFGPTKNPHDPSRVPGGSSGGSAAAVEADLCMAALGSDTGGSIRQPASFCGIVGLKPTYGRVSRHGLIAMASSLDVIGPMTKTVEDAEILFNAIAGNDVLDSTTIQNSESRIMNQESRVKKEGLRNLRIGAPKEYFGEGLDADVEKTIKSVIEKCEKEGAIIKEISLPHSAYALAVYYIIVPCEVSANLARFDGIRYGSSAAAICHLPSASLYEVYTKTRAHGFGAEVKRRIILGTYALSAGYYDAYYLKAQKVRKLVRTDFERAFGEVDVMMGPTTPTPAFSLGERAHDPISMYLADIYTVAANLAGIPALSLPAGFVTRGGLTLPVGLQIIAPRMQEQLLFEVGKNVENLLNP